MQTLDEQGPPGFVERRRRARAQVRWRVWFWGGALTEPVETVTGNLSSDGFYCRSRVPFVPGETLPCKLRIPGYPIERSVVDWELTCRVQVIRVDPADCDGRFGMACRIEDYRVAYHLPQRD